MTGLLHRLFMDTILIVKSEKNNAKGNYKLQWLLPSIYEPNISFNRRFLEDLATKKGVDMREVIDKLGKKSLPPS